MRNVVGSLLLLVALAGCGTGGAPSSPPQGEVTGYIAITPGAALLTQMGALTSLTAIVYAADGSVTTADVAWRSSDTSVATVSADGVVTAVAELGSAQIIAEADGAQGAMMMVFIAQPVAGAQLLTDAQVLSSPVGIDAAAQPGVGFRYRVELALSEVPPVGSVLINTGEKPVGGRVVSATPSPGGALVVMEIIALDEMFERFRFEERIDLSYAPLVLDDEVLEAYDVERLAGGGVRFVPKPGASFERMDGAADRHADASFHVGPVTCEPTGSVPTVGITPPTLTITDTLTLDYALGTGPLGVQKAIVEGGVSGKLTLKYGLNGAFSGKLTCTIKLYEILIPTGGVPLFFVFPFGVGFEMDGKVTFADMGFEVAQLAELKDIKLGFECPTEHACDFHTDTPTFDVGEPQIAFDFPTSLTSDFRFEAGLFGFLFVNAGIGVPLASLEVLSGRAGVKQEANLAPVTTQVENTDYASSFALKFVTAVGPGSGLQSVFRLLGMAPTMRGAEAKHETTLAESPKGSFTIAPASVAPGDEAALGDLATFTVDLAPVTYLGIDAVDSVEIYWKIQDADGGFTLAGGRPGCHRMAASSGQTTFSCQTDFLAEHEGEQTFYAFVHAKLFGVPLPVPLEIAHDGFARVFVEREVANVTVASTEAFTHATASACCDPDPVDDVMQELVSDFVTYDYVFATEAVTGDARAATDGEVAYGLWFAEHSDSLGGFTASARIDVAGAVADAFFAATTARAWTRSHVDFEVHHQPVLLRLEGLVEIDTTFEDGSYVLDVWVSPPLQEPLRYEIREGRLISDVRTLAPGRYTFSTRSEAHLWWVEEPGSETAHVRWELGLSFEPVVQD